MARNLPIVKIMQTRDLTANKTCETQAFLESNPPRTPFCNPVKPAHKARKSIETHTIKNKETTGKEKWWKECNVRKGERDLKV